MVTLRPSRNGRGFQYDIRFRWPDGSRFQERRDAPVTSRSAAQRWAQAREAALLAAGREAHVQTKTALEESAATLEAFWPRVVQDHYLAERLKPSAVDSAKTIARLHLIPTLGSKPLDQITNADIAALKGAKAALKRKTVNNILAVLSKALRCAVRWGAIKAMPCVIELFKTSQEEPDWYEVHDYRRLVDGARKVSTAATCLVLLGGSAGLRRGEIVALKWTDLDLPRRLIKVERAIWRGYEDTPKGGRGRVVPMTPELADALRAHRHLVSDRVLCNPDGADLSNQTVRSWVESAQRRAGLAYGGIHRLRHTFCSHLAAAGAPARAIQGLAGHTDLKTTQRYMHLSPADRAGAIGTLAAYYVERNATDFVEKLG